MQDAVRNNERWKGGAVRLPKILVRICKLALHQMLLTPPPPIAKRRATAVVNPHCIAQLMPHPRAPLNGEAQSEAFPL